MTQEHGPQEKLDRLVNALIEETLAMSDEEILADGKSDEGEVERALRAEVVAAVALHRRKRLDQARAAVAASKGSPRLVHRSPGDLRAAIAKAIASNDTGITLAARDGRDVPDSDLEGLAEDLSDLGIDLDGIDDPDTR